MPKLLRVALPLVILAAGVVVARGLIASKKAAELHEIEVPITHVEVTTARRADHRAVVRAMGVVRAQREVVLQPEVGGRVIEIHPQLLTGGHLGKGDALIRVDPRDYSAAVAAVQAELSQARLAVREEATLRRVAEHEWGARTDVTPETLEFALREPHLEAANARVSSVRTRIDKAKRDLQRTILRAPFDAIVLDETLDIGQIVGPQTPVARLAGTERFWVQIAVPVDELGMLEIPGMNTDAARGSTARILHDAGGGHAGERPAAREGFAERLLIAVEERGRMAQLFVVVEDPLGLKEPPATRPMPLLIGRYVEVELEGRELRDVIALPRTALHDDTRVWIVDAEGRLRPREIEVAWREDTRVFVRAGLAEGDRVVTSALATATDGMAVSVATDG